MKSFACRMTYQKTFKYAPVLFLQIFKILMNRVRKGPEAKNTSEWIDFVVELSTNPFINNFMYNVIVLHKNLIFQKFILNVVFHRQLISKMRIYWEFMVNLISN